MSDQRGQPSLRDRPIWQQPTKNLGNLHIFVQNMCDHLVLDGNLGVE